MAGAEEAENTHRQGSDEHGALLVTISAVPSEVVFQRELNLAHAGPGGGNLAEACSRRLVRTPPAGVRSAQFHVVGSVEHLHAELESLSFGDSKVLDRREI